MTTSVRFVLSYDLKYDFIAFKVDILSMKIYIVVMVVVNDDTYSRKSVNTHDVIQWKTPASYDKNTLFLPPKEALLQVHS